MGMLQSATEWLGNCEHLGGLERLGRLLAADDLLPQAATFKPLHGQEREAGCLMDVKDADDVGVREGAGDPGLGEKPLAGLGVGQQMGQEHLDGDLLLAEAVEGGIDGTHAARAKMAANLVALGQQLPGAISSIDASPALLAVA